MLPLQESWTHLKGMSIEEQTTEKDEWDGDAQTCVQSHCQPSRGRERKILKGIRICGFLKWRTVSMSVSPCLTIYSVTVGLVE